MNLLIHGPLLTIISSLYAALSKIIIVVYYKLGKTVTVTCAATGGTTPYQYQVSYKKASTSTYTTVQDYSTNKTVTIKPGTATTYQIRIKAKDKAGKVSTSVIALNVTK